MMQDPFPFEYMGGGYFRRKGVPKGQPAEMLHGMEVVEYLYAQLEASKRALETLRQVAVLASDDGRIVHDSMFADQVRRTVTLLEAAFEKGSA